MVTGLFVGGLSIAVAEYVPSCIVGAASAYRKGAICVLEKMLRLLKGGDPVVVVAPTVANPDGSGIAAPSTTANQYHVALMDFERQMRTMRSEFDVYNRNTIGMGRFLMEVQTQLLMPVLR